MESEINGFKIIKDFGVVYKEGSRTKSHYVMAICKQCQKEWKTSYYMLHKITGCGCNSWKQLKPLPDYINGFRIIKCHGYNTIKKNGRWATIECKECKKIYDCDPNALKYKNSCGCVKKGVIACKYAKSHPQLTQAIKHMLGRCYNKNNTDYYNYGARGITVCDEWIADRNIFCEWSIAHGFEEKKGLSIDRVDSKKGYSPDNCRWTNAEVQARNTRRVKMTLDDAIEIRMKHAINPCYRTKLDLANEYGVSDATIYLIVQNKTWKE